MANKKWLVISYCCIFLSIYFLFIAFSTISSYINSNSNIEIPQTTAMNATSSAMSMNSSWEGMLLLVGIFAILLFIIFNILGARAMGSAV